MITAGGAAEPLGSTSGCRQLGSGQAASSSRPRADLPGRQDKQGEKPGLNLAGYADTSRTRSEPYSMAAIALRLKVS